MLYQHIKPMLDFLFALLLLPFFAVVFVIIATIIKLESKGPVLFKQVRKGANGKNFIAYKFRSMRIDAPKYCATNDLENHKKYITNFGAFMRRTGLDESAQLFNVLKGDMSFIGPRPVIPQEKKLIALRKKYGVDKLKPGIGGWAQANGRDEVNVHEKARMDALYAEKINFMMDLKCLLRTISVILTGEGHNEGRKAGYEERMASEVQKDTK